MEIPTYTKCASDISHYYVFEKLFIEYDDAISYCDKKNIPYDFIVKTKYIIDYINI